MLKQFPCPGDFLLKWRGDRLVVELGLERPRKGRAALRTNLGHASVRRREIIAETERGIAPMAKAWSDIPMEKTADGKFRVEIALDEVGVFSGKACFFPEGSAVPEWPEGANFHVKVESADVRRCNSIYTVFPRQFGSFREVVRRLPLIMDAMGFRIIQTLPPFPVPTTYAVMGEYGCPFAALDFYSVDPAMAEFDESATPLDQFRELVDAVHARDGLFFVDLPANHTGWASVLQTSHPEWFVRDAEGRFVSPGAWGVKWADLVQLDYSHPELCAYMADVFLFWCRNGVDGFRCDAGYMIPAKTWEYIVARVREEYPDAVFMLEGLGGDLAVTDRLLAESGLDWAYSEIFQTYDRGGFDWYLPGAIARAEKYGALVHFAETHDNDRLAKGGETYARLRVQLAALLSWQGAWGIANGVEWFATEKIDVHGKNDLNWGAKNNMVDLVARLNFILATDSDFAGASHLEPIVRGEGNVLAVLRNSRVLVLANLDCSKPSTVDFDRRRFPYASAFDLLAQKKVDLSGEVRLGPGEVLCLRGEAAPKQNAPAEAKPEAAFHWRYPRDLSREVVVPAGEALEISAADAFRVRIVDPGSGVVLQTAKSGPSRRTVLSVPGYCGDGTRARRLKVDIVVYSGGAAKRGSSALLVPPPPEQAKMLSSLDGETVRENAGWRAILSNGAGAAAQIRIGWGEIYSQYDAILAANPNPSCPSDRLNLWARTRIWLQREGFVRQFDSRLVESFFCDAAGRLAKWRFRVPCGMGMSASFEISVSLKEGANSARMLVRRIKGGADDVGGSVRLVFRPDIEWRSFHSVTKAFAGLETLFPGSVRADGHGFAFSPYGETFAFSVSGGEFHGGCEWTYNVPHPEEAARGQEPAGDLFSPGWISADLAVGGETALVGRLGDDSAGSWPDLDVAPPKDFASALRRSMELFIVRRDGLKTVIAGYPWFLDWGRDTFIFMRGMIAAGMVGDSLKILKAFAAFESGGTLPNIIYGDSAGNRDTTDAPLWFVRCVKELGEAAGEDKVACLRKTCESIVDNYIKGTANGIKADPASALVWSPSHFTWMDTNYPACTPREGYPVEIQALWISALEYLGRAELAKKAKASLVRYFKCEKGYCDVLSAPDGTPAADAVPDRSVRPNQLFLLTLGVVDDPSILEAVEGLLVPGGIRSLDSGDALYRGVYAGDEDTSRKPAYHNGTAWAWPFPLYAEALAKAVPKKTALSLLAGAVENLNSGALCQMSEIADGDAPHAQKGCAAQAWSISELLRVWLKFSSPAVHDAH